MPNTVRLHRVSQRSPKGLSPLHRGRRRGEVAAAQRICLHRAPPRRESRRQLPDVIPHFHHGQGHSFAGQNLELVPGACLRYTDKFDDPNRPGENHVTGRSSQYPTAPSYIVQEGLPEAISGRSVLSRLAGLVAKPRDSRRAEINLIDVVIVT